MMLLRKEVNLMRVKVENLRHIYNQGQPGETAALDDVSFEIENGSITGLIGHTGSGKSTLVQHLNALLKPDSGKIFIGDTDITEKDVKLMDIRKRVGLVFQYPEYQLFEASVKEDVAFGPKNLGLEEEEINIRVDEALRLVGLDPEVHGNRSPFELSGGQKRRAAVAGVIAMKPKVLILDEPTAGLDPRSHMEILDMIRTIHAEQKCTIIIVSHNMDDVAALCDRVIVMNKGKVALNGSPKEVFSQDDYLKSIGLGLPAAKELLYKMKQKGLKLTERASKAVADALTYEDAADMIYEILNSAKDSETENRLRN